MEERNGFKVKDKVRLLEDYMTFKEGDTGVVTGFWVGGLSVSCDRNSGSMGGYFSRFEKVEQCSHNNINEEASDEINKTSDDEPHKEQDVQKFTIELPEFDATSIGMASHQDVFNRIEEYNTEEDTIYNKLKGLL